jgi:hypothetical protein
MKVQCGCGTRRVAAHVKECTKCKLPFVEVHDEVKAVAISLNDAREVRATRTNIAVAA